MRYLATFIVAVAFLTGCSQDVSDDQRRLERAEEKFEEARERAAERIARVREDTAEDLAEAREEAREQLERARERLQDARERIRDAADDVEEDADDWSRGARREAEDALEQVGIAETLGRVMEDVGRALQDDAEVSVVDARALRDLLPEELLGMERYNSNSDNSGRWGVYHSHAKASYRASNRDKVSIVIADLGTLRGLLANSGDLLDAATSRRGENGYSRTTRINGYPAHISQKTDRGNDTEYQGILVVAERFVIVMEAEGDFDDDVFEDVFTSINLRRLSRLAE